ncbi:hypothetical protein [Acinetobacter dispersus]|uniref:Uncharacterized protein n=1 Tax=Acinetobacter dispersus TaxID=70348 RepID=N9L8V9_9GAMM|nr:hypothetical protein [Acinetobacter dispersus]ENW92738.1 hypothetical protein F904_02681 [Acinetobacter dispersus]
MTVHFEIYAPDGSLQLSTETKPIGRHKEYIEWIDHSNGAQIGPYIIDPENKQRLNPRHHRGFGYPRLTMKDGFMYFMQLNDGAIVSFSPDFGSCVGVEPNPGRILMADVREFIPTPQHNEHLQVFNQHGQMVWGSESLAHSIQLIDWHTIWFGDHNYHGVPQLFFDVPHGVDINRVFFYVSMDNAMFGPRAQSTEGVTQFPLLYMRRRGNRIFLLPDFYTYFNTYTRYNTEDFNSKISYAAGGSTFQVLVMYVPNL